MALSAYENFAASDALSNWTARFVSRTYSRQTGVSGAEEGTTLLCTHSANARSAFTWNLFDSDGDRADFEVVLRWRSANFGAGNSFGPAGRIAGSASSETVYYTQHRQGGVGTIIAAYNGGTNIPTIADDTSASYSTDTWYCTRFRVNGTALKAKVWAGDKGDEPATPSTGWTVEVTNSTISSAGLIGIFMFVGGGSVTFEVDWIGVATGGGSAPTAPVSAGPTITSIPSPLTVGQTGVEITGTGFGTDEGTVYINTSASDTGREVHPVVDWTDTSIELDAIDKQALSGSTFYFKVEHDDTSESDWFGPVTINEAGYDVEAEAGSLVATPYSASIQQSAEILADAGALEIEGQPVGILAGQTVEADAGALEIDGKPAEISVGETVQASLGQLVLAGQPAEVLQAAEIIAELAELRVTPRAASITTSGAVDAALAQLQVAAQQATIEQATAILADAGALILSAVPAAIEQRYTVTTQTAALVLDALVAELRQAGVVQVETGALIIDSKPAGLRLGDVVVSEVYQLAAGPRRIAAMTARSDPGVLVHIEGEGFESGASVAFGEGVAVSGVTFVSDTLLTATIAAGANASLGFRTCVVTNPDNSAGDLAGALRVFRRSFFPVTGGDINDPSPWDASYWHGDTNDFPEGGLQWEIMVGMGDPAGGFIPGDLAAIGYCSFPDVDIPAGSTVTAAFMRAVVMEHNVLPEFEGDAPFTLRLAFQLDADPPVPEDGSFTVGDPEVRINFPNGWITTDAEALIPIPFASYSSPSSYYQIPPVDLTGSLQEVVALEGYAGNRANLQFAFMESDEFKCWYGLIGAFPTEGPNRMRLFADWVAPGEGETIVVELASLIASGRPVTVEARVDIEAGTASLVLAAGDAQVTLGKLVQAEAGLLRLGSLVAEIVAQSVVAAQTGEIIITPHPAETRLGDVVRAELVELEITPEPASIITPIRVQTALGLLAIAGVRATIVSGDLRVSVRPAVIPAREDTFAVAARQEVFVIPPSKGTTPIH